MDTSQSRTSIHDKDVFSKESYVFKKQSQSLFSAWDKRYIVLKNHILTFYEDEHKKQAGKVIDMTKVACVNMHYDESAPIKSKKLEKKDREESRFDVYTPERVFMLKADGNSFFDATEWVKILQKAAKKYNP